MNKSKLLTIVLSLMFGIIAISQAQADIGQIIQDGIDYLEANQDESGYWGTDKETPYRDGAVTVDVLARLDIDYDVDSEILESGYQAVNLMSTTSTDYLARKIIAAASVNEGVVDPDLLDSLANMQNDDGGWGYQKYYGSNTLETALAIKALVAASYEDPEPSVLTPAGDFLVTTQNSDPPGGDFGWGFVSPGDSKVFFTAHAVIALSALQDYDAVYDFSTQIANAFSWLQLVIYDGGFGSDGNINAYETGLAIAAMVAHDPGAQEVEDAWGYLESTQLTNGSWDNDAYSTAMAIYGLHLINPANFLDFAYFPGDANMSAGVWPPAVTGSDVTYLVNYFGGITPGCDLNGFYCSGDANGDCQVLGSDVTALVNYLIGIGPISYCEDYPPTWPTPGDLPPNAPDGWPNCESVGVARTSPPKTPLIKPALNSRKNEAIKPGGNTVKKESSIIKENQNDKKKKTKVISEKPTKPRIKKPSKK